jgi:hypothetical protein
MSGSTHNRSVLIGVEYRNWSRTLDVYLLFAILLGQIISKVNYRLATYKLPHPNSKKSDDNLDIGCQLEHFKYEMNQT